MAQIVVTAQLRCVNGNFVFPSANGNFGVSQMQIVQTNPGGAQPGGVNAISTGQGTLIDISTFSPALAPGGWLMFLNSDPTNACDWGPDDGAGNIKICGQMQPGEPALFRNSPNWNGKMRFKSVAGTPFIQAFILVP